MVINISFQVNRTAACDRSQAAIKILCSSLFLAGSSAFCHISLFCFQSACFTAVFHINSCSRERLSAASAGNLPASFFCCFLPVILCPAISTAEHCSGGLCTKCFTAAFAGDLEQLSNGMFASLDLLIALPALYAVTVKLFLALDLLRGQFSVRIHTLPSGYRSARQ